MSRRGFLAGGAGLAGVVLLGRGRLQLLSPPVSPTGAVTDGRRHRHASSTLEIFSAGFPRAFIYRQAGDLAGIQDYVTWVQQMSQLNGILGKVLPEEQAIPANVVTYFTQFKQQFPNKMVLEHLNGWERVPQWETTNWWAGFWLHKAGSHLTQPCAATDTVLSISPSQTSRFSLRASYLKNRGDDICIAAMGSNGSPDFTQAEQVILTGINTAAGTVTVQRGQYGTTPLSFAAGAFIAPHVTRGPFVGTGPMLWMYNFSTVAPPDPNGKTVVDAIINGLSPGEGLAAKFAAGGPLAFVDGLKLDAFSFIPPLNDNPDCNNDGIADDGIFNGISTFGLGQANYVQALRAVVGNRLIFIDADVVSRQRPDSALVSGIELEGFPNLYDSTAQQWSEALGTLSYYTTAITSSPNLVYPNYKTDLFSPPITGDNILRLSIAASLITGTAFTFYNDPDGASVTNGQLRSLTIWDELLAGTLQTPNWLGQPTSPAQHLSLTNDVLAGSGVTMSSAFTSKLSASDATFSFANQGTAGASLTVTGTSTQPTATMTFSLSGVPLSGSDLIIKMDVMSSPETVYSSTLLRRLFVAAQKAGGAFVNTQSTPAGPAWFTVILYFRNLTGSGSTANLTFSIEGPTSVSLRNVTAYNAQDVIFRQFQSGAVFANPSLAPYTFPVSTLAPGINYKRLQATSGTGQDPTTNNGQPLGANVTIPATDALIVING